MFSSWPDSFLPNFLSTARSIFWNLKFGNFLRLPSFFFSHHRQQENIPTSNHLSQAVKTNLYVGCGMNNFDRGSSPYIWKSSFPQCADIINLTRRQILVLLLFLLIIYWIYLPICWRVDRCIVAYLIINLIIWSTVWNKIQQH